MDIKSILSCVDHTLLSQSATTKQIIEVCDDALRYKTASVCIPPTFVKIAKDYVKDNQKICTVIGFPNGYNTTKTKCFETADAIENGADEIDMVINIGLLKEERYTELLHEIKEIKKQCCGKTLKVIIETCLLSTAEKIKMCEIVTESGADFIKTSTGFAGAGATKDDIKLFSEYVGKNVRIKAAGGISTIEDAQEFLLLGASRLGTSRIVKIVKEKGLL